MLRQYAVKENMRVDFNKLSYTGNEIKYIQKAMDGSPLQGGGQFMNVCEFLLRRITGAKNALLTTSCTSALDMAAIMCNIESGDEVIAPSYTFVSTINSFVLRGARPVFCDVHPETLNIDETKLAGLITERTKVIVPVHYAGVACDMDAICAIAKPRNIAVVEDAAQAFNAYYKGRHLGTIGQIGTLSFHSTKNVIAGECGALLTNDDALARRANYIREKGTNRIDFVDGKIDKYTWIDYGSSYIPSELIAAFLSAQLEQADELTQPRIEAWGRYAQMLSPLEEEGKLHLCKIPPYAKTNAHIFFIYLDEPDRARALHSYLKERGVSTNAHYQPLHTCPMALKFNPHPASLPVVEKIAQTMLRLPMYASITEAEQSYVCDCIKEFFAR